MSTARYPTLPWALASVLWLALALEVRAQGPATGTPAGTLLVPTDAFTRLVPAALPCLLSVLERARYGVADIEAAAWLVHAPHAGRDPSCIPWPPVVTRGKARWQGPLPQGLLAQVHSHPTRATSGRKWTPLPSQDDCLVARRLGVPVLTVSLFGVFACQPEDGRIVALLRAGWERASYRAVEPVRTVLAVDTDALALAPAARAATPPTSLGLRRCAAVADPETRPSPPRDALGPLPATSGLGRSLPAAEDGDCADSGVCYHHGVATFTRGQM